MKSRSMAGVTIHAEYQHIAAHRGMLTSSEEFWVTRLVAKFPKTNLILEEKYHESASVAKLRYNHLRQAIGVL